MMKLRINPVVAEDLKTIKNFIAEEILIKHWKRFTKFVSSLRIYSSFPIWVQSCPSV